MGRRVERIDEPVFEALEGHDWPGNVRELEDTIERAVVLSTGPVLQVGEISMLRASDGTRDGLPSSRLHENVSWVEQETIRRALE